VRHLIVLLLVVGLVIGLATPALAQQEQTQVGPPSWIVTGTARQINPDQNKLVLTTDKGEVKLDVTGQSTLRGPDNNPISLGDIKEGDRLLAAFHGTDGRNEVFWLYKPAQGQGGGEAAAGKGGGGQEAKLGPGSSLIQGKVEKVKPEKNRLVVRNEAGKQGLKLTGRTRFYGLELQPIKLGDIQPNDRVLAAYQKTDGKNVVSQLYKLPK
jgi:hypothetical protein